MDLGLRDKIVFITGASSGIRRNRANFFSVGRCGCGCFVWEEYARCRRYRQKGAVKRAACLAVPAGCQRSGEYSCSSPPPSARNSQGLDALVLCAGLSLHTEFTDVTPQEWEHVMAVNLNGPFYVLQALTPLLREAHPWSWSRAFPRRPAFPIRPITRPPKPGWST